jgi:shikimate dehydrogenase
MVQLISADQYGVIGDPISHSQSPSIHKLFAQQLGHSIDYKAYHVSENQLESFIYEFRKKGGRGLNITLPHKTTALKYVDIINPRAKEADAINTLIIDEEKIIGDNTDGIGLINDLEINFNQSLKNKRILILGAGGATLGILSPLLKREPKNILVANRTASKAKIVTSKFKSNFSLDACGINELDPEQIFDIIINATSIGITKQSINFPSFIITENTVCYDLSYSYEPTLFMRWGVENKAKLAIQGWGMLIEQAAASYCLWRDKKPNTSSILKQLNINASSQVLRRL